MARQYPPLHERLFSNVERRGGCLLFRGSGAVYGKIKVNGRDISTHRVAWELTHGPIPDGLFVLHHCDQPRCINPKHLFLGTQKDNLKDMHNKGRGRVKPEGEGPLGEDHWCSKLTAPDVQEARRLYQTGAFYLKDLAGLYGVSKATIYDAIRGHTWKHVPHPVRPGSS
jgi:hypothetical protein